MPAITIIEDHALLAESLVLSLRQNDVQARALPIKPAPELLEDAVASRPDLVLLDLDLAGCGDGASLVAPLRAAGVATLVVTGITDRLRIATALEQGALGYQPKAEGLDSLLAATLRALSGSAAPDEAERHALLSELAQHRAQLQRDERLRNRLTEREQATLSALGDGWQVREIAERWVVSEATVRTHVRGVLTKLGAGSQLAAVAFARRRGWLESSTASRPERSRHRAMSIVR